MIGHGPPARNVGEFCRLKCDDRDYECKVVEVGKDNHVVETIGFGLRITYPAKDLLPSLGKAARDEQEALARNFVENQVLWKVGDQCKVLRDGMKADAKIVELASDENGRAYAVVCFLDNSVEDSAWLDDLKFPLPITWKVGDFCRAKWSEDQVIYEASIQTIESGDTGHYALVEFLGYGNQDTVWVEDIMISNGDAARKAQIAAALNEAPPIESSTPVSKVDTNGNVAESAKPIKDWKVDDRCRAYCNSEQMELEGTVKEIKEDGCYYVRFIGVNGKGETKFPAELMKSAGKEAREKQRADRAAKKEGSATPKSPKRSDEVSWEVGSDCRALSTQIGMECEGIVKSIDEADGNKYAVVQFLGYGIETEESVWLVNLMPSQGEDARKKQIENIPSAATDTVDAGAKWKVGDECRAVFEVDNLEYEGTIEELAAAEDRQYAIVKFIGYGDVQSVWAENILASKGKEARDAQMAAAAAELGETIEEPQPAVPEKPVEKIEEPPQEPKKQEQPQVVEEPAQKKTRVEEEKKEDPMPAETRKSHVEVMHVNGIVHSPENLDVSETDASFQSVMRAINGVVDRSDGNNNIKLDLSATDKESLVAMLEEAQKKIVQLQAKINIHEAVISEMRDANIFLKKQILPRVEFLCSQHSHVETLRAEKKTLLDDIISRKADQE